jgi:hypothetical protein
LCGKWHEARRCISPAFPIGHYNADARTIPINVHAQFAADNAVPSQSHESLTPIAVSVNGYRNDNNDSNRHQLVKRLYVHQR